MNPGVGIVGVEIEQARSRPLAFGRRELLLAELTQSEDQGPADRNIILPVQLRQDLVRIRAEGTKPVNEVTAGSRVGPMLEDRPHLLLAIEPQECHGRIGLALRQSVLGLFRNQRPVPDRCRHRQTTVRAGCHGNRRPGENRPRSTGAHKRRCSVIDSPWSTFDSNCVLTFHKCGRQQDGLHSCRLP